MSQTAQHDADHGDIDPGLFAALKQFIILGQAAPGRKPGECSFYYPTPLKHVEPLGANLFPIDFAPFRDPETAQTAPGVFNDLDLPAKRLLDPDNKAAFGISTIGPDQLETGKAILERFKQAFAPLVILDIGLMHQLMDDEPIGIYEDVPLAALDFFATVVAAPPPFWLVFTDWLSMMAGKSISKARHWHPVRSTYRIALITSRMSTLRGRPPDNALGISGSKMAHSCSLRSLG